MVNGGFATWGEGCPMLLYIIRVRKKWSRNMVPTSRRFPKKHDDMVPTMGKSNQEPSKADLQHLQAAQTRRGR